MPSVVVIVFHIFAGVVAIASGAAAMLFRKGSRRHRLAGTVFGISMLSMAGMGAFRAFVLEQALNTVAGLLTLYLVSTGWRMARRSDGTLRRFDRVALVYVLTIAVTALTFGIEAAQSATGRKGVDPAAGFFAFGTIAVLFVISDLRMLARGSLTGAARIRRHLWRMSLALLIAAASFYPGQAHLFPESLRTSNVLYLPLMLIAATSIYWLARVSFSRAFGKAAAASLRSVKVAGEPLRSEPASR